MGSNIKSEQISWDYLNFKFNQNSVGISLQQKESVLGDHEIRMIQKLVFEGMIRLSKRN